MSNAVQQPSQKPSFNWRSFTGIVLIWVIFGYFYSNYVQREQPVDKIAYSQFKQDVKQDEVARVTFRGQQILGNYKSHKNQQTEKNHAQNDNAGSRNPAPVDRFRTYRPQIQDPELIPLLENHKVAVFAEKQEQNWLGRILISFLPWLLIIGFFLYSSKKFQKRVGGRSGIFGFGKSKAKRFQETGSDTTFEDVAGLDNAKRELQEIVAFLKEPSRFTSLGGELPHGLLLVGPPGVGKTLLAKAAAGEAVVPFFSISGSEFIEMFVGVGASRVRDMFERAKKEAPAIIFIDEIDSIGRSRGTGLGGGHDEREQTLNQILSEMDGFSSREPIIVIAATNRPDVLDPALVRPGRFDRQVHLELPQKKARKEILQIHLRKVPVADDMDLENLARRTVGLSGADLKNLINEAALLAARGHENKVSAKYFDEARDKILLGIKREDVIQEKEKRIIAYHEAGHALIAARVPTGDPLQKVTIIPRGPSLGVTEQIPEEDRHNLSRRYLLDRIAIMLGGRAAEQVVFEDLSTGAGDDLKKATSLARRMVCQWGMSTRLGPVTFKTGDTHPFLGRELSEPKDFSESTAKLIDEEIRTILSDAEKRATRTLTENRGGLDALARHLLEEETLSRVEVDELLETAGAN